MKILKFKFVILFTIITLAALLRLYKLGTNPPGLYWDEAVMGYDAYSILKTGKDHHGVTLPLFFESYGDWKLPVYHYSLVPSIAIFGLNEFAIRFPSAFFGTLTVPLIYLLTKKLFEKSDVSNQLSVVKSESIALLAMLMLAISPWHVQFSRGAFESTVGLSFIVFGVYLFLLGLEKKNILLLTFSLLLFILSMYTYHAYRIFTSLFIISLVFIYFKEIRANVKKLILPIALSVILLLPLLLFTFSPSGRARAISQSVFNKDNYEKTRVYYDLNSKRPLRFLAKYWSIPLNYAYLTLGNYLDHFSPIFLFYRGDQIGRHSQVDMGQIYLFDAVLVIFTLFAYKKLNKPSARVMLSWLLLAPIPAIIVTPNPHALRTLQMSIPLAFFTGLGAYWIFSSKKLLILKTLLVLIICYSFLTYLHLLFIHYPKKFAADWQDGNKEMVLQVQKYQDNFDKVYITNINQASYIYLLFYLKFDPRKFIESKGNSDSFGKYSFVPRDINLDNKGRILYVAPSWEKVDGNWLAAANDSVGRHIYSLWEVNGVN